MHERLSRTSEETRTREDILCPQSLAHATVALARRAMHAPHNVRRVT
jgi:hypothetical protein